MNILVRVNVQEFLKLITEGGKYSAWHSGNFIPHECASYIHHQTGDWANVVMAHVSLNDTPHEKKFHFIPIQFKTYQLHQNFITTNNRTFPKKACWDSSVGIVTGYGLDGLCSTLAMQDFSLHPRAWHNSGATKLTIYLCLELRSRKMLL
jgi:hypothetical protein